MRVKRPDSATPFLVAAVTFIFMLDVNLTWLPSIPGAPGLPNFYVPVIAYFAAQWIVRAISASSAWLVPIVDVIVAGALGGACTLLVVMSLLAPTHRECVEGVGRGEDAECTRYEVRPGGNVEGAFIWGIGAFLCFGLAWTTANNVLRKRRLPAWARDDDEQVR